MSKKILGLDLGSNSLGWALLSSEGDTPTAIIDLGVRIFNKAVEEKTPTPKNAKRRERRLARRVLQRRARRKQRMLNYLVSRDFLPKELHDSHQPEIILNELGDPYQLRAKALDEALTSYELGRVLLHLVQRRGFLSNKKTLLGQDMLDDPDVIAVLEESGDDKPEATKDAEESAFKNDISKLKKNIDDAGCRTLGEYLSTLDFHDCKRNRSRDGGHLRTDRQMYRDELDAIWSKQSAYHPSLTEEVKFQLEEIIFFQRPLKLKTDRIGKCSLEKRHKRCEIARLEYQKFRYLQDINNLQYLDHNTDTMVTLPDEDKEKLCEYFEHTAAPTFVGIRKILGLKGVDFNLETDNKKLKGNTTACAIRKVLPEWDKFEEGKQYALMEDLLSIKKKTALKKRLQNHWGLDGKTAVSLCMLELEPGHGSHSLKAVKRLLPYLQDGDIYSSAREQAGYGYEQAEMEALDKLGAPPEIPNPIVQKGLHEIRRVVNAIIAEYGKPDVIRIEMARDLEMNTERYKKFIKQQNENTKANDKAVDEYKVIASRNPHLGMSQYPSKTDKIKYRLWRDQDMRCAYSGKQINMTTLFSAEVEIDHILPFSQSLDDSYMNKVVCFASENRYKGNRTPMDAFGGNEEKWGQITSAISRWKDKKKLRSKIDRFYKKAADLSDRDFIGSQLTDTRYISKEAGNYLKTLGVDVTYTKGVMTSWLRNHWQLNDLIGETDKKERTDHRHHAIDAVVTACIGRRFYNTLASNAKIQEGKGLSMNDLLTDPPFDALKQELGAKLKAMIVSFQPQRKISGEFHEETGAGFIEGVGTVYRKNLDGDFNQVDGIIDPVVKEQVRQHLSNFNNNPKQAFAENVTVFHKDGKTPIKRVRVKQSGKSYQELESSRFGIRNKEGNIFRWMAYGNLHHVEIIKNKNTGKYKGVYITVMEAAKRARGVDMRNPVAIVRENHGDSYEFVMCLHKNDLVSIQIGGTKQFYRVQVLEQPYKLELRLHTAATLQNMDEALRKSINSLMMDYAMTKHITNAIGKLANDKTNH